MARPLRNRLIHDLGMIRKELLETVSSISTEEFDYAPREGMKSYRAQLVEIGAMEFESSLLLRTGRVPDWKEAEAQVVGETTDELIASLSRIRSDFLDWLNKADGAALQEPIPIPESWWEYMGDKEIEAEELVRWIARHEYYHLAQIIAYRWIQGHNPYSRS